MSVATGKIVHEVFDAVQPGKGILQIIAVDRSVNIFFYLFWF